MHARLQAPALEARPGTARAQICWVQTLVAQLQALEAHCRETRLEITELLWRTRSMPAGRARRG
ncbi:MAG: hypothetical protein K6U87_16475 [Firmicutes bacterium]|nr:hypothetical protein [Bacillota bacterium]